MLTRYSFGWLAIPVVFYLAFCNGQRRFQPAALALGLFVVIVTPWVLRNVSISGTPLGTAGYSIIEGAMTSGTRLERSLKPKIEGNAITSIVGKLVANTRVVLQNDLPRLAGNWVTPLFLVGLMLGFNNPAIRRLRYFLLGCLLLLIVVQALGRTHLTEDSPDVNSENLLVLLAPLVLIYGVSLFFVLLEQINFALALLRYAVVGAFTVLACMPLIFTFLPPRPIPVTYPPYFPPRFELTGGWMKDGELMMSDVPWAVAWYGKRQCIWTTLDAGDDFFAVNDYLKPIRGLYLTQQTMDARFVSGWIQAGERSWGNFIVQSVLQGQIPGAFPLRVAPPRSDYPFLPDQLFLTDWERWKKTAESQ
jgi:hypothetical protein